MKIKSLTARPVLDSRGHWTVEASLILANGAFAMASVPQGKSTGSAEAHALPGAAAAEKINKVIAPRVKGHDFKSQAELDWFLMSLDGTSVKKKLGANAILAVSVAFLRAEAAAKKIPLWKHIRATVGSAGSTPAHGVKNLTHPRLFINVVNGGLHAGNNLDFQEYLIIPRCKTIRDSVDVGTRIYQELGKVLIKAKGRGAANLGDEGGYAPDFKNNIEPFTMLRSVSAKLKLSQKVDFGLDAAATDINGKTHKQLAATYEKLIKQYGLIYIEDPFGEEDFLEFAALNLHFGDKTWISGDDLTTTNVRRMHLAEEQGSVNAVIIKPNQIGSVTEAFDAVRAARKYGWAVVASHRSGETNDDFIADFAYGVRAEGLKLGAPARGERIAKYNRLLVIEQEAK